MGVHGRKRNSRGQRGRGLDAFDPEALYVNRELSWLAFNERILEEALDPSNPLLERLRFLIIFHTNLDEFFMVRVSGLKQLLAAGVEVLSRDGLSPRAQLQRIGERLEPVLGQAQTCLRDLLAELAGHGVEVCHYGDLTAAEHRRWDRWYDQKVHPILTPLAVGPLRPFPFISNLSLNLAVMVRSPQGEERLARVKIPPTLPRLVPMGEVSEGEPARFLLLDGLVASNVHKLFPGMDIDAPRMFRVTRDADVEITEDEAEDLLTVLEEELRKRRFGLPVRLEIEAGTPDATLERLRRGLALPRADVHAIGGLLGVPSLDALLALDLPHLKYRPFVPRRPAQTQDTNLFAEIRNKDILLHHPFQSFSPVVEFVSEAANDPRVLAIKQTLYRTSGDSPVIAALEEAIENGKQVAAVVELKARFDEENNIVWARRLEEAGVHVIYGIPKLKVHAKLALVVRDEGGELRRYAHIGTGNYNPSTARVYSDFGLLTADPAITRDVADVFNRLTGFAQPTKYPALLVAPTHLKKKLVKLIRREAEHARNGGSGHIIAKCNAITEETIIGELYEASRAGVRVDLLVRGICCLYPGRPGLSEHITVRSVVGRFLEHSRVYWFANGGDPAVFLGSADLMGRNLDRRVEVVTPVRDADHKAWLRDVYLQRYLEDEARTRLMLPDGSYTRLRTGEGSRDVHEEFLRSDR